jgi:Tfp pilus assembly protein PilZ
MGAALDISQGSLLLETTQQIEPGNNILITADVQNRLIEINAKSAYCRGAGSGKLKVGVSFHGTHDGNIQFVKSMIRANYYCRSYGISK